MAAATKCILCKKCHFPKLKCDIYMDGIPKDIVFEISDCDKYEMKQSDINDDLPLAKGR